MAKISLRNGTSEVARAWHIGARASDPSRRLIVCVLLRSDGSVLRCTKWRYEATVFTSSNVHSSTWTKVIGVKHTLDSFTSHYSKAPWQLGTPDLSLL